MKSEKLWIFEKKDKLFLIQPFDLHFFPHFMQVNLLLSRDCPARCNKLYFCLHFLKKEWFLPADFNSSGFDNLLNKVLMFLVCQEGHIHLSLQLTSKSRNHKCQSCSCFIKCSVGHIQENCPPHICLWSILQMTVHYFSSLSFH